MTPPCGSLRPALPPEPGPALGLAVDTPGSSSCHYVSPAASKPAAQRRETRAASVGRHIDRVKLTLMNTYSMLTVLVKHVAGKQ